MWVANYGSNNVTELSSTGTVVGTYSVGNQPWGIAFDGTNMWVGNSGDGTVTKILASNGTILGTFNVGRAPWAVAFDGANIWVANHADGTLSKR